MVYVACSALLLVFSTAGLLAVLEPETLRGGFWVGVWWALVTITTVGYGDVVPATPAGKLLGIVLMLMGIGLVSTLLTRIEAMMQRLLERQAHTPPERPDPTAALESRGSTTTPVGNHPPRRPLSPPAPPQ